MSTDKGYIKVYRDIRDHWIWQHGTKYSPLHAWLDLIMMMNHEDGKVLFDGKMVDVERGSRITSLRALSQRWNWSIHKVSDFLNTLESEGMISQKRDTKKTLITLINYGLYQNKQDKKGTPKKHSSNTEGKQKEITGKTQGNKQDIIEDTKEDIKKKEAPPPDDEDEGEPWPDDFWED